MRNSLFICVMLYCMSHVIPSLASETDIYAVTPENCGEMTLDECEKAMIWAKEHSAKLKAKSQKHKDNIARMHEEALEILAENDKKKKAE